LKKRVTTQDRIWEEGSEWESEKRGNERNIKGNEEGSRKRWKIRRCRTEKNLSQKENTVGKWARGSEEMGLYQRGMV